MKLSCLPVSFFPEIINGRMSVVEWACMGAELGLEAIDLSILFVPDRSPAALANMRREIEGTGMRVAMITSYPDFTHPSPEQRERELELEKSVVETARQLGAAMVRVTAGQAHPQTPLHEGIQWATQGLIRLAESTRNSEITLVYENHAKPGIWQYTDFSQPPELFLEIFRRTADVGLGINFDTGNASTFAEDPVALLTQIIPRVDSVHASDSSTKGELNHTLLGTGITPFHKLFRCLKQSGWDGWICMEEASFQGRQGIEAAAKYIRRAWREAQI